MSSEQTGFFSCSFPLEELQYLPAGGYLSLGVNPPSTNLCNNRQQSPGLQVISYIFQEYLVYLLLVFSGI